MYSFLAQLAEKIAKNNEIPLEQTVIIVPNKRASRELLRELAWHFNQPVFAPNICTVNEFIESLSFLKKIEQDELLVRLFDVYKKKNAANSDDFITFLAWAPLFLQDINEIDLHLANASAVFSNLAEIKTLETSFGKENLTEAQRKYLAFYNQLSELYINFNSALSAENLGYEGMIFKDAVAQNTNLNLNETLKNKVRYIFAGFNAVTPAELELMHFFYVHKNAELYFDIDHFYDAQYGAFIKDIRQKLRISEIYKSNDFKDIPKQITCIGAPKRTAQILQAIEILNNIEQKQGDLNNTVLVLADESMLLPFVHAYNPENANITMGYPLSGAYPAQQLQQYIDEEKQNNRLQKPKFDLKKQGFEFLQYLISTFRQVETIEGDTNFLIINILEENLNFLQRFFNLTSGIDFAIVEYFLKEQLNATSIPFSGNAHEGLQIMGLLETRMLDFKNVIVLSMNEGILPKGKSAPSLLLYDIKKHFGLPTHQRRDSIFGYHFFRLLQRATEIYLIYDNETTDALSEKSRFVEQLAFEVKKQQLQEHIHISYHQFVPPFLAPECETKICIEKTATVLGKLTDFKYSPSSLNAYIQCPLQFYWRYIEKITLPETFDSGNESAIIGTIIHSVLDEIFKQLQEKSAHFSTILNTCKNNIDDVITRVFQQQKVIFGENIYEGKLFLAYQIVKKTILDYIQIIHKEWETSPFQIIATESSLIAEVCVEEAIFNFSGIADRIELRDNKVTILDYKTGKVEGKKLQCKMKDMELIFTDPDFHQLFQLLCYAYIYQKDKVHSLLPTTEIQCGIIAFQELYKQNETYIYYAEIGKDKILTNETLQIFEIYLKQVFSSIIDKKNAICQTEDAENCTFCDYKIICNK